MKVPMAKYNDEMREREYRERQERRPDNIEDNVLRTRQVAERMETRFDRLEANLPDIIMRQLTAFFGKQKNPARKK